ncbi:MAG: SDR family NAD(P)-dependent oxidoreductase [Chloroflexota bacterium]
MIAAMNTNLTNQVAIVTGAAGPYGEAIARALAAAGARVALNDINPDRIARLAAEIRDSGGEAIDITADVGNKFQCVNIVESTREVWGRLDILVNAISVRPHTSVIKMDEWEWMRCMDVNLKGTFLMSQLCGRVMSDENSDRGGAIINLVHTEKPSDPINAAFAASMAGVVGFAHACAREYEPYRIGVHTILLGEGDNPTATRLDDAGLPTDLAAAVVALCDDPDRARPSRLFLAA